MRLTRRSIPWISISIPWIGRSIPWKFASKAYFQRKMEGNLCHIAAKFAFSGVPAAGLRKDVSEYEMLRIFAYLRVTEQPRENNRFSVLKTRAADR